MTTLCIDPGVQGLGTALFGADGRLLEARYFAARTKGKGYHHAAQMASDVLIHYCIVADLIIEHPRVYPGMPKTDPNDLVDVAVAGAAVAGAFCTNTISVYPSEWKGQVKKQVMLNRIKSKLTPDELLRVEWTNKSDNEDILDAIGIGLWHFKRLGGRTYPGASK